MISLIICSLNDEICNRLKENIEFTIGISYELIIFNNKVEKKSICEVYNLGVKEAKYDILCFLHEDMIFKTQNWGNIILKYFQDKEIGLIGVAGSYYYSLSPVGWFGTNEKEMNIFLNTKSTNNEPKLLFQTRSPDKNPSEVSVIDGVFMAFPKKILDKISFSENLLKNFHGYDVDISLQVFETNKKIIVVKDIIIEHFSNGTLDSIWFNDMNKLAKKWEHFLPAYTSIYSNKEITKLNKESLWNFYISSTHHVSTVNRIRMYFHFAFKQSLMFFAIIKLSKYYIKRLFLKK